MIEFIFKYKKTFALFFVLALGWSIYSTLNLNLDEDILNILPKKDPIISNYRDYLKDFSNMNMVFILVGTERENFDEKDLIEISDHLYSKLKASSLFKKIFYTVAGNDINNILDFIRSHRANYFTSDIESDYLKKISKLEIEKTLNGWIRTLSESPTPMISTIFRKDPLNLDQAIMQKFEFSSNFLKSFNIKEGRLFDNTEKHILIMADPIAGGTDTLKGKELIGFMNDLIIKTKSELNDLKPNLAYINSHRFSLENANQIKGDIALTLSISFIAILIVAFLTFSSPINAFFTIIPSIIGGLLALGIILTIDPRISSITIGAGSLLIAITIDSGMHLMYHLDQNRNKINYRLDLINAAIKLKFPILTAAITTVLAFLALIFSSIPGYKEISIFAMLGVIMTYYVAIYILPFIIPVKFKFSFKKPLLDYSPLLPKLIGRISKNKSSTAIFLLSVTLISFIGLTKLKLDGDVQNLNATTSEIKKDYDAIFKSFNEIFSYSALMVSDISLDEALRKNEMLFNELRNMQNSHEIINFSSLHPILLSQNGQKENIQRWVKFWEPYILKEIKNNFNEVAKLKKINPDIINEYLLNINNQYLPFQTDALKNTILNNVIESSISDKNNKYSILTTVKTNDYHDVQKLISHFKNFPFNVKIANGKHFVAYMIEFILKEMFKLAFIAFILIVAYLYITLKEYRRNILAIIIPLFVTLLWTFGILGLIGMKINIVNCIISVFVFGLVIDFSIFLFIALKDGNPENLATTSGAIVLSAVTTILGMGALVFAKHPALSSIGYTTMIGITCGIVSVLVIIPLLVRNKSDIVS